MQKVGKLCLCALFPFLGMSGKERPIKMLVDACAGTFQSMQDQVSTMGDIFQLAVLELVRKVRNSGLVKR